MVYMKYSVVIPVFNEAKVLRLLYQELKQVMDALGDSYELIFISDGSKDESLSIMEQLQSGNSNIVIINFKNNLGQTKALQAGFEKACGEIVITLDADMQNDPADIPALLQRLKQGYDLVCGWRRNRRDTFWKRVFSRAGNICQRLLLRAPVHDISCTLKVLRRNCIKQLKIERNGLQSFIPFILHQKGYRISEVVVHHRPRMAGHSKYSLLSQIFEVLGAFFYLRSRLS